jgi:hypothetical protein
MQLQTASVQKVTSTYKTFVAQGFGDGFLQRGEGWQAFKSYRSKVTQKNI